MTIEELINNSKLIKKDIELYLPVYNSLINQLLILSQENNGVLPSEFILSDNHQIFINLERILNLFKLLNIEIDIINSNITLDIQLDETIPRTIYADNFYKLYLIKIQN